MHLNRRQRIEFRNKTERMSEIFDWSKLVRHYHDAHDLAISRTGGNRPGGWMCGWFEHVFASPAEVKVQLIRQSITTNLTHFKTRLLKATSAVAPVLALLTTVCFGAQFFQIRLFRVRRDR